MARATKLQIKERIEFTKTAIIQGNGGSKLEKVISSMYKVTDRQARNYITEARQELSLDLSSVAPFALAQTIARLEALYKMCVSIGDFKTALDTLKEFSKLMNLYPAQKVEHTWKHEIRGLVNAGVVTREEVQTEFGDELAHELFGTVVSVASS